MYLQFLNQDWGHTQDTVYLLNVDYSCGATGLAYTEDIGKRATLRPNFYGSWTTSRVERPSEDEAHAPCSLRIAPGT